MFKAIYVVSPEKAEPAKRFVFGFQEQEQCYKWFTTKTGRNLPEFCIIHLESSFGEGSEGSRFSNKITASFFRVPCRIWNPFAEDLSFYRWFSHGQCLVMLSANATIGHKARNYRVPIPPKRDYIAKQHVQPGRQSNPKQPHTNKTHPTSDKASWFLGTHRTDGNIRQCL